MNFQDIPAAAYVHRRQQAAAFDAYIAQDHT